MYGTAELFIYDVMYCAISRSSGPSLALVELKRATYNFMCNDELWDNEQAHDVPMFHSRSKSPHTSRDTCHGKCPPPTYMHMYQCHLSPLMSQPSPPLPHPLPPDSGGDMPEKWQGSDTLHPPSPGGSTLLFYVVGLPLSPSPFNFPS